MNWIFQRVTRAKPCGSFSAQLYGNPKALELYSSLNEAIKECEYAHMQEQRYEEGSGWCGIKAPVSASLKRTVLPF